MRLSRTNHYDWRTKCSSLSLRDLSKNFAYSALSASVRVEIPLLLVPVSRSVSLLCILLHSSSSRIFCFLCQVVSRVPVKRWLEPLHPFFSSVILFELQYFGVLNGDSSRVHCTIRHTIYCRLGWTRDLSVTECFVRLTFSRNVCIELIEMFVEA